MSQSRNAEEKRILIVEDHPLFHAMLAQLINAENGMNVCYTADNVLDAMTLVEKDVPDAAIIDLTLKGMSGLELIKQLKTRDMLFPILVISMHEERLYAERALRAGARGYISKQEPIAEVVKAIHKVLDGQIYVSERVSGAVLERLGVVGSVVGPSGMDTLSDREIEVFQLVGHGLNSREIGKQLKLSISTVDSYRARIKIKLGIKNAADLYQCAAVWLVEGKH